MNEITQLMKLQATAESVIDGEETLTELEVYGEKFEIGPEEALWVANGILLACKAVEFDLENKGRDES